MQPPSYEAFLAARGFDPRGPRAALWRRMFVTCWGEPGFPRFWRLWNPFYAYYLFRLYLLLGGRRRPLLASFVVFVACGFFLHDLLLVATTRRFSLATTFAFAAFWLLTIASRALGPHLCQERWPRAVNAAVNVVLVVLGLAAGAFGAHGLGV